MMKERFSPKTLSDITGVSIRTLHYYHEKGLLVPQQMSANGYRYYNVQDISKLQYILFLKELDLTLKQIQIYFEGDSDFRTKILHDNFYHIVKKRDRLNDIIRTLEHHFHKDNDEIEVTTMQNFNLNEQYEKEAASKYGDIHYYQAYKDKQKCKDESEQQNHFEEINKQLNMFFDEMNQLYLNKVSILEASGKTKKLQCILKEQVPNCDNQFLEYIAQIYIEDERFVKFINKQRERGLNLYISDTIKTFIKL